MNQISATTRQKPRTAGLRLDLGFSQLLPQWKAMLSPRYLREDVVSGLTVACVAIPLSLAIALASGVAPEVGLVTAIVAGIACALFNGTPLAVSGPAAAMAVLIASAVENHGLGGLLVIGLVTGALQLLTGVLGLGKLIRFVPVPVIAGFTAGIGAIILVGQLPRAFGLPPPAQSHVIDVFTHLGAMIGQAHPGALVLTVATVAIALGLPKIAPKLPAPLVAVVVPSVAAVALGLDVELIGALPASLPMPSLPALPEGNLLPLLGTALVVYLLASLETLLSSGAVDKLARNGERHDPDQELVGQGIGNAAVALFGGIPVTGVIARSALNVQSGARTRRSAIIHAFVLIGAVYLFAPVMARIPIAALAGVLLATAMRMLHPRELIALWKSSRSEAVVYAVTFVVIVATDLIVGVQAGVLAALAIAAIRLGRAHHDRLAIESTGPHRFLVSGPLTFLAAARLEKLRNEIGQAEPGQGVVLDMAKVTAIDSTAGEILIGIVEDVLGRKDRIALHGLHPALQLVLRKQEHGEKVAKLFSASEGDVARLLAKTGVGPRDRLLHGVERFKRDERVRYGPLFDQLASGQSPHTLLITCADSRIDPNLITSSDPGELFIVRNVGNLVPHPDSDASGTVGSAIEYAIAVLGVTDVVVCGHSACGAMNAVLRPPEKGAMPSVERWLEQAHGLLARLPPDATAEEAAQLNARLQLENAAAYAVLRRKVEAGEVRLHAWFYDVGHAELREWDDAVGAYVPLGAGKRQGATEAEPVPLFRPLEPAAG
ncbi:SulP family inorganic anion transporter [Vulgatibacter sp.]|uniref:SulP family inorganic anion transporter n=1 Tax=Vulgatibacter sp. TaxID=1971226 RepID=UPI00356210DE